MPSKPLLANTGAMSQFIGPFDVASKLTDRVYHCRFSHLWNAIATRHSDTIDTKFFVDGAGVVLGLTDREASFLAAEYLRERLEEEDERPLYDVSHEDVMRLIKQLGIR